MSLNDENNNGDGMKSFWIPCLAAFIFFALIGLLAWSETRIAKLQIENNVDKSIDFQIKTLPVHVPKYDSSTQKKVDKIEADRKISIDHINNYYGQQLQDALDSTFNKE